MHLCNTHWFLCIYNTYFNRHWKLVINQIPKIDFWYIPPGIISHCSTCCDPISQRQFQNSRPSFRAYTRYPPLLLFSSCIYSDVSILGFGGCHESPGFESNWNGDSRFNQWGGTKWVHLLPSLLPSYHEETQRRRWRKFQKGTFSSFVWTQKYPDGVPAQLYNINKEVLTFEQVGIRQN